MATKRNETRLDARKDYSPSNESLQVLKDAASARRGDAKVDRVVFDPLIRTATVLYFIYLYRRNFNIAFKQYNTSLCHGV